jgi:hypothetical protein
MSNGQQFAAKTTLKGQQALECLVAPYKQQQTVMLKQKNQKMRTRLRFYSLDSIECGYREPGVA